MINPDDLAAFKASQREGWASFVRLATFTLPPAARLVRYAGVQAGQRVLDVACGTGVVALTAALQGADVNGLDLTPALLEEARRNAELAQLPTVFTEGDVEALPYADAQFDVVLSQFGHMFAPRPAVALAEMLRVLKPGGRLAFSTWPPELMVGQMFTLVGRYLPAPAGVAAPTGWGDAAIVRQRLGDAVTAIEFDTGELMLPALGVRHYRSNMEATAAPVAKVVAALRAEPERLAAFRGELEALVARWFSDNQVRQTYLLTRAIKRAA